MEREFRNRHRRNDRNDRYDRYDRKDRSDRGDRNDRDRGEAAFVFSKRVRAGRRRTYFFDVKATRSKDYYLTITESKKRFHDNTYERHKLHLYKEDFNKFLEALQETVEHVKNELMPEYDFDEYTRPREESQDFQNDNKKEDNFYDDDAKEQPYEDDLKW